MAENFGEHEGQTVRRATLESGQARVSVLNYGAVTQDWRILRAGQARPVVLGFERFEDYPKHSRSFGIIAGRVANRTAKGQFTLDGQSYQLPTNNGPNHLHGGTFGLGRCIWEMDAEGTRAVHLRYRSPEGEEGYPGTVDFELTVTLRDATLTYEMTARPDRPTPVNLAQHNYYNLGGETILEHQLHIAASQYTPVDDTLIPTGEIAPVQDTHFDFTAPTLIGAHAQARDGIDLNLVLDSDRDRSEPAATLKGPDGVRLSLWTDQPGVQVFNAPKMEIPVPGLDGRRYGPFSGLCLEPQKFPDALNQSHFPSVIATPEEPYRQRLAVEIV